MYFKPHKTKHNVQVGSLGQQCASCEHLKSEVGILALPGLGQAHDIYQSVVMVCMSFSFLWVFSLLCLGFYFHFQGCSAMLVIFSVG